MNGAELIEKWPELRKLTVKQILDGTERCAGEERDALLKFLLYLSEVERRGLYSNANKRSLWEFLEETLQFTKAETRLRYHSARLLLRFPVVAEYLADGRLNMTTLVVMKDLLTRENVRTECDKASNRTKTEVEEQVAAKNPTVVDFAVLTSGHGPKIVELEPSTLPETAPAAPSETAPIPTTEGKGFFVKNAPSKAAVKAYTATQSLLTMTLSKEERAELDELCELLSEIYPDKDPRKTIVHAVRKLRTEILKKRGKIPVKSRARKDPESAPSEPATSETPNAAAPVTAPPSPPTVTPARSAPAPAARRYTMKSASTMEAILAGAKIGRESIPAETQRFVWIRDNFCCQKRLAGGQICGSTYRCQIDHLIAVADNGSNDPSNLQIHCRKHNLDRARERFGNAHMDQAIARSRDARAATKAARLAAGSAGAPWDGSAQGGLFRDRGD